MGLALWFQYWTSAIDWPVNIGGKPFNSLPAFVPIIFEVAVLFASLGVVLALFLRCGLFPGRRITVPAPGVLDDRFALVAELRGAVPTQAEFELLMKQHGAVEVLDGSEEEASCAA